MRTQDKHSRSVRKTRPIPATTEAGRESQLISLAIDLAEQQLMDGTASAQVITHYLKLATEKERTERRLLEKQVELAEAKVESLKSAKRVEELYEEAIRAMKKYNGYFEEDDGDEKL